MVANNTYLFSYFINNGEDGLHLAFSADCLNWSVLNRGVAILKPTIGKSKLMRDPCLIMGADNSFHLVWTVGWRERGIGISHSKDLINWAPQELLPVMEHEPQALNCWAPELFYDDATAKYLILWSTTIPGRFPETEMGGDLFKKTKLNHRIYYTSTSDFVRFEDTKLLYDGGFNVIDATLTKFGGEYLMVVKDETRHPVAKNLRITSAAAAVGPYTTASPPFTPSWVEGPSLLQHDNGWFLYFDKYSKHKYGCFYTEDFNTWKDVSKKLRLPRNARHGFAFTAPREFIADLLEKYPPKKKRKWFK